MRFITFALISAAAVVAFDALASLASLAMGFPYQYASLGSILIYVILSFAAARRFGFWRGVLLGALLGFVDATAGWAISWAIGPGRVPGQVFGFGIWAITLATMVGLGAICGLIGAAIAKAMPARVA